MTKNQIMALVAGALSIGITSCDNTGGMKKTSDGLMYKIVKDEPGDKFPEVNDIIKMHVNIRIGDSILLDSRKMNGDNPFEFPMPEPTFKSDWVSGIKLLTAGDSAVFYVPVDSAKKYAQGQFPEFAKSTDTVVYEVKFVSFESAAELKKKEEEAASKQMGEDDQKLQTYFSEKGLSPQKTESGLYYIIDKEGAGTPIEKGQLVTVNYTGKNLKGETFDSNVDPEFQHVQPFEFPVGMGQVIKGWDEGIMLLKKGSKARFFIPSPLAYGSNAMGPKIVANEILMFDVEVTDVKAEQAAPVQ